MATHDALTGILNRGAIDEVLRGAYSRYLRSRQPYGVIMADLDHFKQVNDSWATVRATWFCANVPAGCRR